MVKRPVQFGAFEFAVIASLRAVQLSRGCLPRVERGIHKLVITAQMEVAEHKVQRGPLPGELVP
jgi:DNA-directed RNA polymerase subunit K/omega